MAPAISVSRSFLVNFTSSCLALWGWSYDRVLFHKRPGPVSRGVKCKLPSFVTTHVFDEASYILEKEAAPIYTEHIFFERAGLMLTWKNVLFRCQDFLDVCFFFFFGGGGGLLPTWLLPPNRFLYPDMSHLFFPPRCSPSNITYPPKEQKERKKWKKGGKEERKTKKQTLKK